MSRIEIVGAGVVGQATGRSLLSFGHDVVFSDVDRHVLEGLTREGLQTVGADDAPSGTTAVTMLCVGTPTIDGACALGSLEASCRRPAAAIASSDSYHLVVVRSTVPPGSTEEFVIPWLEEYSGKTAGTDFGVCYNPEFLRETSAVKDFREPWIVVIGAEDQRSALALREIYEPMIDGSQAPIFETDLRSAEMVKYVSNLYNATKISFTNEVWSVCRQAGIDGNAVMSMVSQAAEAMWNPGYGVKGGFPYGGSCLPKDTAAFMTWAQEREMTMKLLEAVIQVNDEVAARQNGSPGAGGDRSHLPSNAATPSRRR